MAVLLAVGCCLSAVSGQWLDKTIALSDSFGSIRPTAVYCVPGSNFVYVADERDCGIIVVDAATDTRVARIDVRTASFFAYDSRDDKVYLGRGDSVAAVDPSTHQVLSRLEVGNGLSALCYNSDVNKLYCRTGSENDSVTVVDCNTDLVIARIWVGSGWYEFQSMGSVSIGNKVYFASFEARTVAVIDGVGDSLLKLFSVGDAPTALAYSPVSNKLYCSSCYVDEVAVFDPGPDTLLRKVEVGGLPLGLCYNPVSNKLYCGGADVPSIDIIDCDGDSVVASFGLTQGDPVFFLFDSVDNRVFCFPDYGRSFVAISGTGDTIVGMVHLSVDAYEPNPAGYYPQQNRIFVRGRSSSDLYVVDAAALNVIGAIQMYPEPSLGCYVERYDKFYVSDDESGLIAVINCTTDSLERRIFTPGTELGLPVYSTGSDKLYYCARMVDGHALFVVDCGRDSMETTLPLNPGGVAAVVYNPVVDRTYLARAWTDSTVAVLDCERDSVVADMWIGGYPTELACNPDSNRIYCTAYHGDSTFVCAIDGATDSVTGAVFVHSGSSSYDFLCYIPTRDLVVATGPDTSIVVLDGAARQVLQTVPLSDKLWSFYLDRRSNKLFGFMTRSDLAVIDCEDWSLKARLRLAADPGGLEIDTIAERVYVTSPGFECISLVDGRTDRFLGLLDVGDSPGDITWLPQDRKMYVVDARGQAVLVVRDTSVAGVAGASAFCQQRATPTVVRGVLYVSEAAGPRLQAASLLDISGRRVVDLQTGANDVRGLAPGVYFVRLASSVERSASSVNKIVVTR